MSTGRFNLIGQRKPKELVDLAAVVDSLNETARQSSGDFDRKPTEAHLAQLVEDEQAAQDAERVYLAALAEWHGSREWGTENANEQELDNFLEA